MIEQKTMAGRHTSAEFLARHRGGGLFTETVNQRIGAYQAADFRFVSVLGNAVLLTSPGYDSSKAGVGPGRLKSRTLATIRISAGAGTPTGEPAPCESCL